MTPLPFNNEIIRAAWTLQPPIIELRVVCDRVVHHANAIEPSTEGSASVAEAILLEIRDDAAP